MIRIFLFCLVFLFCFSTANSAQQQNTAEKQEVIDLYAWDFGKVKEGELLKHDFEFKNEAKKILKIKNTTASCGCTVAEVKRKVLLPGEQTIVKVQFKTKGYSGKTQQFIYVNTDNLDNPVVKFIIKAEVVKK